MRVTPYLASGRSRSHLWVPVPRIPEWVRTGSSFKYWCFSLNFPKEWLVEGNFRRQALFRFEQTSLWRGLLIAVHDQSLESAIRAKQLGGYVPQEFWELEELPGYFSIGDENAPGTNESFEPARHLKMCSLGRRCLQLYPRVRIPVPELRTENQGPVSDPVPW